MGVAGEIKNTSWGRRIRVVHNDPAIATAVEAGFKRVLLERSVDQGLSFSEVTTPDKRPVLKPELTDYVIFDKLGDASYLYRTRYIDTDDGTLSDPSESVAGIGLAIQSVLTVEQLKQRYLFGVNLTNDEGEPLPDEVFQFYILSAVAWLEHELDIKILPTTFEREMEDYQRNNYHAFTHIQLENYPVISVEEFAVEYPSGQSVIVFPDEWLRLDKNHGILRVVPTGGTLSQLMIGQGGSFLPAIYNGMDYLPDLFAISYTAGFEDGELPFNLLDLIGKVASFGPFNIFGDLIAGAGIASVSLSIDGLSQSVGTTSSATNSGYGARLIQYQREVKDWVPKLRRYYKGIRMQVM